VNKKRILVVEDNIGARKGLVIYLNSKGYEVQEAESGEQAIELLKEESYDIVLSDLMMQRIDGIGVLKEVKKQYPQQTEVIIMTAYGSIDNVVKAMKLGAYDYIIKPLDLTSLGLLIDRCIEKQRLVEEVEGLKEVVNLYVIFKAIRSTIEQDKLLNLILDLACDSVRADSGSIMLFEKDCGELIVKAVTGDFKDDELGNRLKLDESFAGYAASMRQPVIQKDMENDIWLKELEKVEIIKSVMSIPMIFKDELFGTITLIRTEEDEGFTDRDTKLAGIFAEQAAFAINNSWVYENLNKLNKQKSEFLANVSHELKTSLMSMKISIDLLLAGKAGNINQIALDLLKINKRGVESMSGFVSNILDFSQMQADAFKIKKENIVLDALIEKSIAKMKFLAEKKEISLDISLPAKLSQIEVDPQRISQVLENLVNNAIKFTGTGGKINIVVNDNKAHVEVGVIDNGMGISKEAHEKVFERFFMVDNSLARQRHGVGLGLAIAKKIVDLHGGTIKLESEPEKGSKFIFTLPK
jgi:signal transduction histidine kinase/ActR/RegA family two-component response regulator